MGFDDPFYRPLQIAVMLPRQTPMVKHRVVLAQTPYTTPNRLSTTTITRMISKT